MNLTKNISIYYDDVNLIASHTKLSSRKDVEEEKDRIFVSPMPSIVGETFAREALKLGLSVVLHRFCSIEEQVRLFSKLHEEHNLSNNFRLNDLFCAVGLNDWDRVSALREAGCTYFCVDVANGYMEDAIYFGAKLKKNLGFDVMMGNVHSSEGLQLNKFANIIRVGIGNGSGCETTTRATGFGRGQITEIDQIRKHRERWDLHPCIMADGGIKNGSCAAKAFGVGADYIMLGGYWANAAEAQNVIEGKYKFWGCASIYNQTLYGGVRRHSEGKVLDVDRNNVRPLKELVDDLWGCISSAVSYSGHLTLSDFIGNGKFELKHAS